MRIEGDCLCCRVTIERMDFFDSSEIAIAEKIWAEIGRRAKSFLPPAGQLFSLDVRTQGLFEDASTVVITDV